MTTYDNLLLQLLERIKHPLSKKWGLEEMQKANLLFKAPHKSYPTIHVAGTNGKGSVCLKLAKSLEKHGMKVGLYTSPHLYTVRERIQINGNYIPKEAFVNLGTALPHTLRFFEWLTLLAFCYFREEKVDIAIIEVGLGGRLDATNIITPTASVITTIGLDHQELLGTTRDEIAREKGGIIKPKVPLFLGPKTPSTLDMMAQQMDSPCFRLQEKEESFDTSNQRLAKAVLSHLGCPVYINARPPCRLEKHDVSGVEVVFDVAHNEEALRAAFSTFTAKPITLFSMGKHKDIRRCAKLVSQHSTSVYLTPMNHFKAAPLSALEKGFEGFAYRHLESMPALLEQCQKTGLPLFIVGSFFLMAPMKKLLGLAQEESDNIFWT